MVVTVLKYARLKLMYKKLYALQLLEDWDPSGIKQMYDRAVEELSKEEIFRPEIQHSYENIVYLSGLPRLNRASEKFEREEKQLLKRLVELLIRPITQDFKRDQLHLNEEGGYAGLRFRKEDEAEEFLQQVRQNRTKFFGPKYPLEAVTHKQLLRIQNQAMPELIENKKQINMQSRFTHLLEEDVSSQISMLSQQNELRIYNFQSSSGMQLQKRIRLNQSDFCYTAKGSFVYCRKGDALQFYLDDQPEPKFVVTLPAQTTAYYTSQCENFVVALWERPHNNKREYQFQIISIFEEQAIYTTDEFIGQSQSVPLDRQARFSFDSGYFYYLEETPRALLLHVMENNFDGFYRLQEKYALVLNNIRAIEFSPSDNYLATFQKTRSDMPSLFTIIDPRLDSMKCKVVNRTFYVEDLKIVWQLNGKQVSVITDTKQNTQIINYIISDDFPSTSSKFPPYSEIIDFQYSFDSKYCVCLIRPRARKETGKAKKEEEQQDRDTEKPAIYIQRTNSDDKPERVISIDAERLHFCPQTNVFVIIGKNAVGGHTISFVDAEDKLYLASYELRLNDMDNDLQFDPYGRYLAILDSMEKQKQLNIIDCVGNCEMVWKADDVLKFKWRPEDTGHTNIGPEARQYIKENEEELCADYTSRHRQNEEALLEEKKKVFEERVEKFNKIFMNEQDVEYSKQEAAARLALIRQVCPDFATEYEEIDLLTIIKKSCIEKQITEEDFDYAYQLAQETEGQQDV